jgi:NADPH:quinone reductase-like Zn-dependent oxidoreductase
MKAIVYDKKAKHCAFSLREAAKPVPRAHETVVRVAAVSLNAADYRSMQMGMIPKSGIFGADVAGRIESAGSSVTRFKVGDEVVADTSGCGFGGLAEFVAVPEKLLALKPASVSFVHAAAVPMASITALQGLRDRGGIARGGKVLINGASGGVGTYAVQLAKFLGAEVTAVCGSRNVALVRSLGADRVIDYSKEDFARGEKRYDLILAVQGNRPLRAYRALLGPKGVCVFVGGALSQIFRSMLLGPFLSLGGRKLRVLAAKPNAVDLAYVLGLVEAGTIKPVIERIFPLAEAAEAMRFLGEGHSPGKVVVTVGSD